MQKVIYFDEGSATDMLQIEYGGELISVDEDKEIIKGWAIKDKLKRNISTLDNAREIRKIMIQMMTYPLIEKL